MHLTSTFALLATLASSFVVRADVVPSEPSPGSVYREGQTCPITWGGDDSLSPTLWKGMSIELMTGDNFNMIHLTTVATGQDGTVSGQFQYPCPDVTVNSDIYFYQFTSPTAANKTWTTRFTIADPTGATTPPANTLQPQTNDPIPWGVGALADPSKAAPPPPNGGGGVGAVSGGSVSSSAPALVSTSSLPVPSSTALLTTSVTGDPTPSSMATVVTSSNSALSSAPSSSPSSPANNSATGMSAISSMTSLALSAFAFVIFL